jgi:hypothetical protein
MSLNSAGGEHAFKNDPFIHRRMTFLTDVFDGNRSTRESHRAMHCIGENCFLVLKLSCANYLGDRENGSWGMEGLVLSWR